MTAATAMCDDVETTISRYMPIVYRYVERYQELMERDDLVAIGMAGLFKATQIYKGTCAFATTAHKCVQGAMVDAIRSHRGRTGLKVVNVIYLSAFQEDNEIDHQWLPEHFGAARNLSAIDDTENEAVRSIGDISLRTAVAQLPPPKSNIIQLHYFQGYNLRETAFMLEIPPARAGQLHQEALLTLRGILAESRL